MMTGKRASRAPRLDFEVTVEDARTAVPKDSGHCMIADALMRAYPDATSVAVDLATIRLSLNGQRLVYLTPLAAQHALLNFDAGQLPEEPFRVRQNAAQVTETRSAAENRRKRGEMKPHRNKGSVIPAASGTSSGSVPAREGGNPLPMGTLAGGPGAQQVLAKEEKAAAEAAARDPQGAAAAAKLRSEGKKLTGESAQFRTGRRREFGIRLMGR